MAEFDERLWGAMVDYVTVGVDGGMTVVFRDGTRRLRNDINVNRFLCHICMLLAFVEPPLLYPFSPR